MGLELSNLMSAKKSSPDYFLYSLLCPQDGLQGDVIGPHQTIDHVLRPFLKHNLLYGTVSKIPEIFLHSRISE